MQRSLQEMLQHPVCLYTCKPWCCNQSKESVKHCRLMYPKIMPACYCKVCLFGLLQSTSSSSPDNVEVNESIISLLLKLHFHLSGNPDSYNPDEPGSSSGYDQSVDSRIGDGPYFVAKLLQRISALDSLCRCVCCFRLLLWHVSETSWSDQ